MREQGRIKFWQQDAGYGFIRCNAGDDLFVHISNTGFLVPKVGAQVEFDRGTNSRTNKPEAKNVSILYGESHA